ncbi:phage tail assembly protein T [Undibacterium curvum]|uniref:phage tail assembly protein T n=1 Tax=Undibacterium curvum TaxID=2762294 RepID=UPI003D0AE167
MALGKTVGEIEQMPQAEFVEWMEFYDIEPFGLPVADVFHAHGLAVHLNMQRDQKSRPEPFAIEDFRLFAERQQPKPEALVDGLTAEQWRLKFAMDRFEYQQKQAKAQD